MRKVRIASGAGYAGDRIEPALDIISRGNVDYIIFECLAERTIALAQKERQEHPDLGYNPLLEYRMEKLIPLLAAHPVKVITNMGAANPIAAAKKTYEIACRCGLNNLKVAAVTGDDILDRISRYYDQPIIETGERLKNLKGNIISANAYIGGKQITRALEEGADIIITGRVADPSLATGPLIYAFRESYSNYDFVGKTIVAGHLLECAGQVTGGYFCDPGYKDVPELWNIGFPIISFTADGEITLEKLPDTGGIINAHTVKEQLLYEIQDPSSYLTPDVIADFSHLTVNELTKNVVSVSNGTGKVKTGFCKVSVGYSDGFIGEGEISYGGRNCVARAQLAEEILKNRFLMLNLDTKELRTSLIGINSLYGAASENLPTPNLNEVRLRVAVRSDNEETVASVGREVEALYLNGPAGGGGARSYVTKIVSIASILVPETDISEDLVWIGD